MPGSRSVYFLDCDGNKLEFISMLYDDPDELEYATYLRMNGMRSTKKNKVKL